MLHLFIKVSTARGRLWSVLHEAAIKRLLENWSCGVCLKTQLLRRWRQEDHGPSVRPYLKNKLKSKRTWGYAQMIESLLSKHEVLEFNLQYCQNKQTNK
jgi:hypothetical protein